MYWTHRVVFFSLVVLSLLLPTGQTLASDSDGNPPESEDEQGWVEQKINPSTEWFEGLFSPLTQWMERSIQGKPATEQPSTDIPFQGPAPTTGITPQEAARLLHLIHPGQVLTMRFLPPNRYQIKQLSPKGLVMVYEMDSRTGVLLEQSAVSAEGVKP